MKGDKNLFQIIKTGYYSDLDNIERPPYGLKVYFGKMGSGKTLSMVRECYDLCQKYDDLAVITNLALNFKPKSNKYYFFTDMKSFISAYVSCIKFDKPKGVIVLIDEIHLFIQKLAMTKNLQLLTILSQVRKLNTYILGTTQLYNKVDKDIRDYIRINGQIVFCSKRFYMTIHKYVNMDDCYENSKIELVYHIKKFDFFIHTQDLFSLYNTFDIISPVLDLLQS